MRSMNLQNNQLVNKRIPYDFKLFGLSFPIISPGAAIEPLRGRFPGRKTHGGKKKIVC